jgi:molybdopterin-synthase adenylyltransferase
MEKELNGMRPAFIASPKSIRLRGIAIPGAEDRQREIPGFDQEIFSKSKVVCIGAGGIISQIAPTLVRKGIGHITVLDNDWVEPSNLNRQRFYTKDIGSNKAIALAQNLQPECIVATEIHAIALRFEEAIARRMDLACDVAICGVDNNPARVSTSQYFRTRGIPVIFAAVSHDADHGYIFIQERSGPCIACLFPDMADDDRFPCPGTPAIVDILQVIGGFAVYAVDTLLINRPRAWNYRRLMLAEGAFDSAQRIGTRDRCRLCTAGKIVSIQSVPFSR